MSSQAFEKHIVADILKGTTQIKNTHVKDITRFNQKGNQNVSLSGASSLNLAME